jgi:hypothetical protein
LTKHENAALAPIQDILLKRKWSKLEILPLTKHMLMKYIRLIFRKNSFLCFVNRTIDFLHKVIPKEVISKEKTKKIFLKKFTLNGLALILSTILL